MGWNDNNTLLTKPVSLADISIAAGVGGPQYDLGYMIKNGTAFNHLAKFKAVAFPYRNPDYTQKMSAYGKNLWWWKGHPSITEVPAGYVIGNYTTTYKCAWFVNCGIKFLGFASQIDAMRAFSPLSNTYVDGMDSVIKDNFSYVRPQGGIDSEPYRDLDFDGYYRLATYCIYTDLGTESGTSYINANNPLSSKVRCGIFTNAGIYELSIDDLFGDITEGGGYGFTVLTAVLSGGSTITPVTIPTTTSAATESLMEVELDFNVSQAWGKTIIGFYCLTLRVGNDTYYIPVFQSNNARPNTPTPAMPNRRVYKSWYIDNSVPYYALTFTQKQNYGSSFAWQSVTSMTYFMTSGLMNRWYLKLEIPRKTSTYGFGNNAFKIEFAGEFRNSRGQMELVYYTLVSNDTRFVLKNNEVTDNYDWGTSETVVVTSGSGTQTCYLAIYDVFANRNSVETIYGGTIWRVRLWFKGAQSDFNDEPDVEYGGLGSSHLNISVQAIQ